MPSAGNAAGALAAYAAKAGMEAHVFMPRDSPDANRNEVAIMGARGTFIDGHIGDAGRLSWQAAERKGLFDVSTLREPYRVEGKKTMGYENAEQMDWTLPDASGIRRYIILRSICNIGERLKVELVRPHDLT